MRRESYTAVLSSVHVVALDHVGSKLDLLFHIYTIPWHGCRVNRMPHSEDDAGFGPLWQLKTVNGRLIWDFTLLFEDALLIVAPLALGSLCILIECAFKLRRRVRRTARAFHGMLGWSKLVGPPLLCICINVSTSIRRSETKGRLCRFYTPPSLHSR